jgi:asparagine synthetase B (glutamine-hydrolysing)
MCGIHASISTRGFLFPSHDLKYLLCNRGPDHLGEAQAQIRAKYGATYWISFISTVLALRGGHITRQPFVDLESGSALCWNGEAWKVGPRPVVGNDGQAVFDLLIKASSSHNLGPDSTAAVLKVIQNISGPFTFVYLDKTHDQIYFGRDRLGRRSLLYNTDGPPTSMEFASVEDPARGTWKEVDADAIYMLSFRDGYAMPLAQDRNNTLLSTSMVPLYKHPWAASDSKSLMPTLGAFNRALPAGDHELNPKSTSVTQLRHHLCESLKLRILNVPKPHEVEQPGHSRIAVLFSGGLDCTVLARMSHDLLPSNQQIDLINVAFENPRVIQAAKNMSKSKKQAKKHQNPEVLDTLEAGLEQEVSVEEPSPFEACPDRETGRRAFQELQHVCPERIWRFIAVNVPFTETMTHRAKVITLIHPHNTEMDLSIAYALYFAARGTGISLSSLDESSAVYTTPARVLLSGLGADELFGGYTRHATAFARTGYPGLHDELELDVYRLGKRNLGRDDRVISHWGREARFPYLDESLVKWAVEAPIWDKCGFHSTETAKDTVKETPDLEPGKKVLRLLAHELGMHSVAQEKKRAIQFGARTAKMETGRIKGTALIS